MKTLWSVLKNMTITYLVKNLKDKNIVPAYDNYVMCTKSKLDLPNSISIRTNPIADFYNHAIDKTINNTDFYFIVDVEDNIDLELDPSLFTHRIKEESQGLYFDYLASQLLPNRYCYF